jgi:hypothetical protein
MPITYTIFLADGLLMICMQSTHHSNVLRVWLEAASVAVCWYVTKCERTRYHTEAFQFTDCTDRSEHARRPMIGWNGATNGIANRSDNKSASFERYLKCSESEYSKS